MAAPDFSAILAGFAQNGVSQADIARRLQLDPSTVCRIANGQTRSPTFETGAKILVMHDKSLKSLMHTNNRFGCK